MTPHAAAAKPGPGRRSQRGVTLIELMVALLLAMLLGIAILFIQRNLTQHNSRTADIALRDNEARAAMDLIVHDLSGAGFLFGGSQLPCDALFTYNAAYTAASNSASVVGHYIRFPVDAIAAATGTQMPFAPTLTLNYPSVAQATAGLVSDVLVITGATGATNFGDAASPLVSVAPNPAYTPALLAAGVLPLVSSVGVTAGPGRAAVLQVPDNGRRACMRVPVVAVGSQGGSVNITSAGNDRMPANAYAGFATQMVPAGLTGPLTNAEIFQARLVDLGAPPTLPGTLPAHTTTAFYVDGGSVNTPWPTLMRATYSLLDDSLAEPLRPIAAGVVSLQVLFGVDPGNTGAVTAYRSGAFIATNRLQAAVLSMRVALVTRSLYADADFSNQPRTAVAVAEPFVAVPIPADFDKYRYVVHQTEVALRNCQWQRC